MQPVFDEPWRAAVLAVRHHSMGTKSDPLHPFRCWLTARHRASTDRGRQIASQVRTILRAVPMDEVLVDDVNAVVARLPCVVKCTEVGSRRWRAETHYRTALGYFREWVATVDLAPARCAEVAL